MYGTMLEKDHYLKVGIINILKYSKMCQVLKHDDMRTLGSY